MSTSPNKDAPRYRSNSYHACSDDDGWRICWIGFDEVDENLHDKGLQFRYGRIDGLLLLNDNSRICSGRCRRRVDRQ
jgi:hypothetical protein